MIDTNNICTICAI